MPQRFVKFNLFTSISSNPEHLPRNHYILETMIFYTVGAASSRDYRMCMELPGLIAAGSRAHKGKIK